jgi:hypothetical protein
VRQIAPPEANDLVDYFDNTYVLGIYQNEHGRNGAVRLRRVPPAFPPRLWNVHEATVNEDPRTNNVSKAWNNKFAHMFRHQHPTVWKCIKALQIEEHSNHTGCYRSPAKKESTMSRDGAAATPTKSLLGLVDARPWSCSFGVLDIRISSYD